MFSLWIVTPSNQPHLLLHQHINNVWLFLMCCFLTLFSYILRTKPHVSGRKNNIHPQQSREVDSHGQSVKRFTGLAPWRLAQTLPILHRWPDRWILGGFSHKIPRRSITYKKNSSMNKLICKLNTGYNWYKKYVHIYIYKYSNHMSTTCPMYTGHM